MVDFKGSLFLNKQETKSFDFVFNKTHVSPDTHGTYPNEQILDLSF